MALDFIDSCAHSGSGGSQIPISRKWTSYAASDYSTVEARVAGVSILIGTAGGISKTLSYVNERWLGCAAWIGNGVSIPFFMNYGSGGGVLVSVRLEADGTLSLIVAPSNARIWNSAPKVITADEFHYYEFHCLLGGSTPLTVTCDVKVDGQVWASGITGNLGYNASNLISNAATMNQISFGSAGGIASYFVCDIYCVNSNTTDINGYSTPLHTFLGDVTIVSLIPISDHSTQWTPSAGSSHFALVDEIPPDDDTTYISSDTTSQLDDFTFQQLSGFTGTILGAQLLIYAKKDAEGSRAIRGMVGGVAQNNNYGTDNFLYDYYDYFIWPLDSDNGTTWTESVYNAEHFGVALSI